MRRPLNDTDHRAQREGAGDQAASSSPCSCPRSRLRADRRIVIAGIGALIAKIGIVITRIGIVITT
jgi:hypothetical protein